MKRFLKVKWDMFNRQETKQIRQVQYRCFSYFSDSGKGKRLTVKKNDILGRANYSWVLIHISNP